MREPLEEPETQDLASGPSGRDAEPSEQEICRCQARERAQDGDRANPTQRYLVEMIPHSPSRLDEDACARIELVDISLDARSLPKQRLFALHARIRIDPRVLLCMSRKR